jgi:hypothetical protein
LLKFPFVKYSIPSKKLHRVLWVKRKCFCNVEKTFGAVRVVFPPPPPEQLASSTPLYKGSSYMRKTVLAYVYKLPHEKSAETQEFI